MNGTPLEFLMHFARRASATLSVWGVSAGATSTPWQVKQMGRAMRIMFILRDDPVSFDLKH